MLLKDDLMKRVLETIDKTISEGNARFVYEPNERRLNEISQCVCKIDRFIESRSGYATAIFANRHEGMIGISSAFNCDDLSMCGEDEIIEAIRDADMVHITAISDSDINIGFVFKNCISKKKYYETWRNDVEQVKKKEPE